MSKRQMEFYIVDIFIAADKIKRFNQQTLNYLDTLSDTFTP